MATDSVTVCDCRVVLSDCSQLKNYYEHSFVSPDGRWKRAFDYITVIAVRDNKVLSVVSGVFYVDGVDILCIQELFISCPSLVISAATLCSWWLSCHKMAP